MSIYGHKFDNLKEENIVQEQYLIELHISKKDLEDPEVLKKVLEKTEKEVQNHNNVVAVLALLLGICCDVLAGIITGSVLVSIVTVSPFIIGSLLLFMKFVKSEEAEKYNNIKKLESKLKEMKSKAQRLKDSKEKERIIKKCDEALKSISDYHVKNYNDGIINFFNEVLSFLKSPYSLGDGGDSDIIAALHKLGMSKEGLTKFVIDNKSKFRDINNYTAGDVEEDYGDTLSKTEIEKMKEGVVVLNNDDYIFFLSSLDNKLYEVDADSFSSYKQYTSDDFEDQYSWSDMKDVLNDNEEIKNQINELISKYK